MILRTIGLMSGTSLDGIDAACLETDGLDHVVAGPALTIPYSPQFRERLRAILGGGATEQVAAVERELTDLHAEAVEALRRHEACGQIDLIGFHGHTILHRPEAGRTWQIGDGAGLARRCGVDVVADFRSNDVAAGGQGAPLVPVFHRALAHGLPRPLAILNIGGVANVTWIGPEADALLSFDTGPGNALLDDWALRHTGIAVDRDGVLALSGRADPDFVRRFEADPYFARQAPKSLDRDHFRVWMPDHLNARDGAATLVECTAAAVAMAARQFPAAARLWLVSGGGRHNPAMMAALWRRLDAEIRSVDTIGWDGDAVEAQAFAYLAVRALRGLPLSFPGTTGVASPVSGGRHHPAAN
jgi:anhydro-N-acetylmuramic acid kinase